METPRAPRFSTGLFAGALALALVFASPAAYAEGEAYVPPPEAHEGVGGWAVVDPNTGNVHGVIVGTIETFHSVEARGGMGHEYMGCHAGCVLRFQTRATADGNVAGWHGTQTHIDSNGNATQSNDGSVKWQPESRTFSIGGQVPGGTRTQTLVPERTARDAEGMNLGTGIIDSETQASRESGGQVAQLRVYQDLLRSSARVEVGFPDWSPQARTFSYLLEQLGSGAHGQPNAVEGIGSDVEAALAEDGHTQLPEDGDYEVGQTAGGGVDEGNEFVHSIRSLTDWVVRFVGSIIGIVSLDGAGGDLN